MPVAHEINPGGVAVRVRADAKDDNVRGRFIGVSRPPIVDSIVDPFVDSIVGPFVAAMPDVYPGTLGGGDYFIKTFNQVVCVKG